MKELPKYHETFIPILSILRDREVMHYNELGKRVRERYYSNLPEELLLQQTKNGRLVLLDRIGWGKTYLKQAKMVAQPERGMVQITDKGLRALEKGVLTLKDVETDPEFLAYRKESEIKQTAKIDQKELTPQDLIDSGIQEIEDQVKSDLLERVRNVDPYYFELIVLQLFRKMGYGQFTATAKSGDFGIDGIINQDELGLDKIYVQAKRYNGHSVREMEIRNFIGAMSGDTQKAYS